MAGETFYDCTIHVSCYILDTFHKHRCIRRMHELRPLTSGR